MGHSQCSNPKLHINYVYACRYSVCVRLRVCVRVCMCIFDACWLHVKLCVHVRDGQLTGLAY